MSHENIITLQPYGGRTGNKTVFRSCERRASYFHSNALLCYSRSIAVFRFVFSRIAVATWASLQLSIRPDSNTAGQHDYYYYYWFSGSYIYLRCMKMICEMKTVSHTRYVRRSCWKFPVEFFLRFDASELFCVSRRRYTYATCARAVIVVSTINSTLAWKLRMSAVAVPPVTWKTRAD